MRTQGKDCHLHAKERGLRRNSCTDPLISDFQPPKVGDNRFKSLSHWYFIMAAHLSPSVVGISLWWPQQIIGGFPGSSDGKESACNAGDPGLIPGSGRSPGERNG